MSRIFIAAMAVILVVSLLLAEPGPPPRDVSPWPETAPRGYVAVRAKSPPKIDGKLDDAAWTDAPWSESFGDIEGESKPAPRYRTRMKMLWDDRCLYIAAELEEPHVWGNIVEHDAVIFQDNDFEVFIDPDADSHLYVEMEMNARNATWDLLMTKPYKDGGKAIDAWEITGMTTAVHIDGTLNDPTDTDKGWTLEIAIPWKALKEISLQAVPPADGDQWRINFSRVEWDIDIAGGKYQKIPKRAEHNWVWSPQGVVDMHRPERWGIVQFSTAAPGKAKFHPDPAQPARDFLNAVYYAQADYRAREKRYAKTLADLGPSVRRPFTGTAHPLLEATRSGFEASVELVLPDGRRPRWRIDHEARIRPE